MNYTSLLLTHCLSLASSPIRADNFAGDDVRYSPEFEMLEGELARASSVHGSGGTDWQKIREGSEALLGQQSKDLRVAAWLIWSLYQREGYEGLQAGLAMLAHLCTHHWDSLHPRKLRTRAAAVGWLVPRLDQLFAEPVPMWQRLPLFRALTEALRSLEEVLSTHLGEDAPLLLPLCRTLETQLERASQGQAEPAASTAATPPPTPASSSSLAAGAIDNDKDAQKAFRAQQEAARSLCAWWQRQKATDIKSLRLSRTLLWLNIEALPEHNAERVTALRGLPADKLAAYQERFAQGNYESLLAELESSLARSPFWLDGQHLAWSCLKNLKAEQAMLEVEVQLALFLQRVPGLEGLCFHDGTPFASAETQAWISTHVLPRLDTQEATATSVAVETQSSPPWENAYHEALLLLRQGGLKAAVQHLKHGMNKAMGKREHFFWQLTLARLCYQAKKHELARTLLESLDQTLQTNGLYEWEPELGLEVLTLLRSCYELLPQKQAGVSKEEIYRKLCRLDLEAALE